MSTKSQTVSLYSVVINKLSNKPTNVGANYMPQLFNIYLQTPYILMVFKNSLELLYTHLQLKPLFLLTQSKPWHYLLLTTLKSRASVPA